MPYVAPSTVAPGQTYSASAHNVIVEDIIDHESRIVVASAAIVPTGSLTQYIGPTAPSGWLLCEGQEVSRATFSALWDVLRAGGATSPYGNGNGTTTFNVPDLRGRIPVGKGTNTDVDVLGDNEGETTVANRRVRHKHTNVVSETTTGGQAYASIVNNTSFASGSGIGQRAIVNSSQAGGIGGYEGLNSFGTAPNHTHSVGVTVGPQTNSPTDGAAFVVVNYIIKT